MTRRSIVTPVVASVAALALAAVALLYAVTMLVVRAESDAALARTVDVDAAALADAYATGGTRELVARIGDRLAMPSAAGDATHFLVAGPGGRRIAGDVARWPLLSAENSQAGFVTLAGGTPAYARATQLAPGVAVLVAREYGARGRLLARIGLAFAGAGALVILAALLLAWRGAARVRARVEAVNAAFRDLARDPARAVPGAAASDELGELARHAERLVADLAAAVEAQRQVTDQVAHEIRTPLAHLDARVLKLIDASVDPKQVAALGAIRHDARGIAALLDSLLDIASNEARRSDRRHFVRVDLSALARDLADIYADSAEEFGFTLDLDIAPDVAIQGDAMELTRMLSNLLDNAFKHAGPRRRITLAVAPGPRIEVRDDGEGVPPDLRERLFERFQRGGPTQGHGLGLALVRAIAERHGLTIAYRDAAPGAAFELRPA